MLVGLEARADYGNFEAAGACQEVSGERRGRGGAESGDRLTVYQSHELSGVLVEQGDQVGDLTGLHGRGNEFGAHETVVGRYPGERPEPAAVTASHRPFGVAGVCDVPGVRSAECIDCPCPAESI